MRHIGLGKLTVIAAALCITAAVASPAQTFTRLTKFNGENGAWPYYGSLIQGADGNFYGTTSFGGANNAGTLFEITSYGKVTTLYSFCPLQGCLDGSVPYAGLVQDPEGNLYGTTYEGGAMDDGTAFKLTPKGKLTTLHSFCMDTGCTDGRDPATGLIPALNGNFYGVTLGSVFELTTAGSFTTLLEGGGVRQMFQAADGNFYGVGVVGDHKKGSILEITSAGKFKTLYSFCAATNCPDGEEPEALMQAADGNFYGTTTYGGANSAGAIFEFTAAGQFSILYNFCSQANCTDGASPYGGLIQGTDGNFYGMTTFGGAAQVNGQLFEGYGTIYQITPAGRFTTLHTFCYDGADCADGAYPYDALVQGTDGNFYGTTYGRPTCPGNCGTVFKLSMGLAPFVEANPNFAVAGREVNILGNNFVGTTAVTFNGTPAKFKVLSSTYIKAEVPTGTTTGMIEVTTPTGTLSSNAAFRVLP